MANRENTYESVLSSEMAKKFFKTIAPDVIFTFENYGETVKIAAHKGLLAVSSPVFDAMFYGELKEKGDVKITDASAAAFKEFLQFLYNDEVTLTMGNIADVLNLAHKYDIGQIIDVAVEFIKENLEAHETMWCLQLAVKYELDELKALCREKIEKYPLMALDEDEDCGNDGDGEEEESGRPVKKQRLSPIDAQQMLTEVLSITKEIISEQSAQPKLSRLVIPSIDLEHDENDKRPISEGSVHIRRTPFGNQSNSRLWLSRIAFKRVYIGNSSSQTIPLMGNITIKQTNSSAILFSNEFGVNAVEKCIKLPQRIEIKKNISYAIKITPSISGFAHKIPSVFGSYENHRLIEIKSIGCFLIKSLFFKKESKR